MRAQTFRSPDRPTESQGARSLSHALATIPDNRSNVPGQGILQGVADRSPRTHAMRTLQNRLHHSQRPGRTGLAPAGPVVQTKRPEKSYSESSRAEEVYGGNEWIYRL